MLTCNFCAKLTVFVFAKQIRFAKYCRAFSLETYFFKGVGKGVAGLVTRPTGGIVDFASGTFDTVKRATEVGEDLQRVRPARY
jgi:hypothetical protein